MAKIYKPLFLLVYQKVHIRIFYNQYFSENLEPEWTSLTGDKCYRIYDFSNANLSDYTLEKWENYYETEHPEGGYESLYQVDGNKLTIFELDWDRWVGTYVIHGDELIYTYKYQNWSAATETMTEEYPEVYVSKFKRR